jgi:hypothetical protein
MTKVEVRATRDIKVDEELLSSYGETFWKQTGDTFEKYIPLTICFSNDWVVVFQCSEEDTILNLKERLRVWTDSSSVQFNSKSGRILREKSKCTNFRGVPICANVALNKGNGGKYCLRERPVKSLNFSLSTGR